MAYTTACTTVQAVIPFYHLLLSCFLFASQLSAAIRIVEDIRFFIL